MSAVGDVQLIGDLVAAGFRGAGLVQAFSIAQAESHADPKAVNPDSGAMGIFQILPSAHPDVTRTCALDPACASKAAYRISQGGTDWSPWETYTNGSYQQFAQKGLDAVLAYATATGGDFSIPDIPTPNITLPSVDLSPVTDAIGGIPGAITGTFSALATRFLWGIGGLALVVVGFLLLVNPGQNIADAIKAAGKEQE